MPIYEYRCPSCGHEFEQIVRVNGPNPGCPKCEAGTEKKISLSAFHLKGGGWYADGYGSGGSSPASASEDGGSSETAKSDSKSSETSSSSSESSSESTSSSSSSSSSSPSSSSTPSTSSAAD